MVYFILSTGSFRFQALLRYKGTVHPPFPKDSNKERGRMQRIGKLIVVKSKLSVNIFPTNFLNKSLAIVLSVSNTFSSTQIIPPILSVGDALYSSFLLLIDNWFAFVNM